MASGSSNGTTKVAAAVQATLEAHPNFVCMALDASNAFNSICRRAVLKATAFMFPEFIPYLKLMYGETF